MYIYIYIYYEWLFTVERVMLAKALGFSYYSDSDNPNGPNNLNNRATHSELDTEEKASLTEDSADRSSSDSPVISNSLGSCTERIKGTLRLACNQPMVTLIILITLITLITLINLRVQSWRRMYVIIMDITCYYHGYLLITLLALIIIITMIPLA